MNEHDQFSLTMQRKGYRLGPGGWYKPDHNCAPPNPKPEQVVRHESLGTIPGKTINLERIRVRFISYRRRLLDPDDLCPKYFIDGLRYSGLLPHGDTETAIDYERPKQIKVKTKEEEQTVITIEQL